MQHNTGGGWEGNEVGRRAEEVAQWYFRLNGFLMIPSFVLHPDCEKPHALTVNGHAKLDTCGQRNPALNWK